MGPPAFRSIIIEAPRRHEVELRLVPLVARETPRPTESATAKLQLPGGVVLEFDAARVDPRWVAALVLDVARGA